MNKTQLINELSNRFQGNRKVAADALDAVVDTITRTVAKGEKVAITGFGVFEKVDKPARFARNPATGERVRVKKTSVPKFKAGTGFKDVVSGAKKLPKLTATRSTETGGRSTTKRAAAGTGTSTARKASATKATGGTAKKTSPAKSAAATNTASTAGAAKKTSAARSATRRTSAAKGTGSASQ
jgi:DNA-binding protein HU-beta